MEIKGTNLGPIPEFTFKLEDHGVTVLTAPNGSGKSILLDAMQKAAAGKGRLPLRDGQRRGMLDVAGAVITIGAATRHTGEFGVVNLEGRFDLATLVDPKLKSPEACDKQRIRALVSLTGAAASPNLFMSHAAFPDFGEVVTVEATATDDLVEMAAKVKRDYEAQSRLSEKAADREEGHVRGLEEAAAGVDLEAESDVEKLQAAYNSARDACVRAEAEADARSGQLQKVELAKEKLEHLKRGYHGDPDGVMAAKIAANEALNEKLRATDAMEAALETAHREVAKLTAANERALAEYKRCNDHLAAVQACQSILDEFKDVDAPLPDLEALRAEVDAARAAQESGVKIRDAREKLAQASQHKMAAKQMRERSERLRNAAGATDEVLSSAIRCEQLRIESVDGEARLVVDHPVRGKGVPYHELSEGEKWRIAIDLGVEQVGEGGLLVIDQNAWESLDSFVRPQLHAHAKERGVYVLTAEATRDPSDGSEMIAKPFEAVAGN
jgi:energy-coupling factor transporter ATP-binding protein EcfA2